LIFSNTLIFKNITALLGEKPNVLESTNTVEEDKKD